MDHGGADSILVLGALSFSSKAACVASLSGNTVTLGSSSASVRLFEAKPAQCEQSCAITIEPDSVTTHINLLVVARYSGYVVKHHHEHIRFYM
jgi:hypothetical protein